MWGKVKTVCQIIAIVAIYVMQTALDVFNLATLGKTLSITEDYNIFKVMASSDSLYHDSYRLFCIFNYIGQGLLWITAIITVISGVKYLIDNKDAISDM